MSSVWLSADPGVVFVLLVAWGWAALRAGALPLAATPRELGGRIRTVLILTTAGLVLAATRTVLIAMLPPAGWWFVQEKVVLALPLLLVPALAVVALSVPRLITLGRAVRAFNGVAAMPPSLRHAAAHPLVPWPVQVTAYGAAAGEVVFLFVSYPATAGASLAVATAVGAAAGLTWRRHGVRYNRLAGDVIVPSRTARLARSGALVAAPRGASAWPTPSLRPAYALGWLRRASR